MYGLLYTRLGAGRGTRTPTPSLAADFESAASTNSAIPACCLGNISADVYLL